MELETAKKHGTAHGGKGKKRRRHVRSKRGSRPIKTRRTPAIRKKGLASRREKQEKSGRFAGTPSKSNNEEGGPAGSRDKTVNRRSMDSNVRPDQRKKIRQLKRAERRGRRRKGKGTDHSRGTERTKIGLKMYPWLYGLMKRNNLRFGRGGAGESCHARLVSEAWKERRTDPDLASTAPQAETNQVF